MEFLLFLIIANIGLSILAGWIAHQKGRSALGFFFLSSVLSFIVALLVLIAVPAAQVGSSQSVLIRRYSLVSYR
jgi:hypothetical protein